MWECEVCKMRKVPDTGFKMFIGYNLVSVLYPKPERYPVWGKMNRQIRICPKCLKKKTIEIELDEIEG